MSDSEVAAACAMLREERPLERHYIAALLEAQQAEITRLRDVLHWVNRRGGLGVDVHEHIAAALEAPEAGDG